MQFFILVLLICFFVFLYCVYVLANDDFIFLRRDVTMEKIFNMIFIGGMFGLLVSRLFYGFSHISIFKNLLHFLLVPYFPGLSLLGGVVGIGIYLLSQLKRQEEQFPLGRITDFFSIAFLISLPIGFLGELLFSEGNIEIIKISSQAFLYFVLFIIFLKFLLPRLLNGKFKEGRITFIFLTCFCVINLVANIFSKTTALGYFKNFENIIMIINLLLSLTISIGYGGLLKIIQNKKEKQ
jgi:prolipoprotein diacylglyceryltransferase